MFKEHKGDFRHMIDHELLFGNATIIDHRTLGGPTESIQIFKFRHNSNNK